MLLVVLDGRHRDRLAEWAHRHGQPFTLVLTGPAGGTYTSLGTSGATPASRVDDDTSTASDPIELDAVEFCRILAGRAGATGLLTTIVPF